MEDDKERFSWFFVIFSKINVIERERFYAFVEPKMNQIHYNNQIRYESYLMSHLDVWQSFIRTSIISELALNEVTWDCHVIQFLLPDAKWN